MQYQRVLLHLILVGCCLGSVASATDIPPGDVSGVWTLAGSPYVILGDVAVPAGEELSIEPGVEVVFAGNYRLTALGTMQAVGAPGDSIRVRGEVPWDRLRLENEVATSHFAYCVITGAERGINSIDSPVTIEHCRLGLHETAVDIFAIGNPSPPPVVVTDCYIHDNQRHGILVSENDEVEISGCEITRCALDESPRGAIQISNQSSGGSSAPLISGCWIHHNVWQGITGFDLTGAGNVSPTIVNNVIEYNLTGVYLLYSTGELRDNQIRFNFVEGDPNSGAGVMLYGGSATAVVTGNTLTGNFTAFYVVEGATVNLGDLGNADPTDDGNNYMHGNVDPLGNTWSVYSNSVADIKAENNRWDSEDYEVIAETIFDGHDDPTYGIVDFDPIQDNSGVTWTEPGVLDGSGLPRPRMFPNPMTQAARIVLASPGVGVAGVSGHLIEAVTILDPSGRVVKTLLEGSEQWPAAGVSWDGRSDSGRPVPSGLYFCRYRVGEQSSQAPVLVVR